MSEIQNSIGSPRDSAVVDPKCKLYQDLIENDEPVKVYLRIRGRTEDEKKNRTRLVRNIITSGLFLYVLNV